MLHTAKETPLFMCAMCFKNTKTELTHGYCSRENQSLKKTAEIKPLSV